ncbi:unnamed protein product [Cyprideis torosa]|uniref:Uncharacterized protein n=1 Tax=Cyprideis torosa TaxID=163714 RepID=A0A7R8WP49_9CRUS|nr:unnamed protein product [Cyprideis torosa]CAG0901391.1 unnamed protein product [Cyprideis torosa]
MFTDFIKPELDRCKAEKAEYMEFQRLSRLVGQLTKVHTAWQYTEAGRVENESKATYEQVIAELEENEAKIQECQTDIETTDQKLDLLRKQRDAVRVFQ